ncbi:hypothetical protein MMC10_005729 [Thelotrema lepadinum]|nr:hypothetical protein [Thelotrema lepadinum]
MSRRPGDRAAQNQQTIKGLLKIESNKSCADCKRNKHPRWASWNLGIFVCIRCSGIHRGMGTHISRVKSVDLDAWTDEQLQNILKWGNAKANKYWESKLAPGHMPSEAKIENFIRTKYESKRWVMEGGMPDPSTIDVEGDDDVPLNVVREKAQIGRSVSQTQRASSASGQPMPQGRSVQPSFDLIGGDDPPQSAPARPSTTEPPAASRQVPPPKPQQPSQLLGGLDFLGSAPERPSSASPKPAGMSRPDLKQSILSLYSAPKTQPDSAPAQQHGRQASFGGMQTPSQGSSSAFGDMNDAFSGLNFGNTGSAFGGQQKPSQPPPKTTPFPSFSPTSPPGKSTAAPPQMSNPSQIKNTPPLAGGSFFDTGPKPPPKANPPKITQAPPPLAVRKVSNASDGFGEFNSAFNPSAPSTAPITASSIANSSNGLLDMSNPPSAINSARPANPSQPNRSVFNLSAPKPPANYNAVIQSSAPPTKTSFSNISSDPWGSNEWNNDGPAVATPQTGLSVKSPSIKSSTSAGFGWGNSPISTTNNTTPSAPQVDWSKPAATTTAAQSDWTSSGGFASNDAGGWGDPTPPATGGGGLGGGFEAGPAAPKVAPEEDFGDWGSAPVAPVSSAASVPPAQSVASSFSAAPAQPPKMNSEDLWGNVWE